VAITPHGKTAFVGNFANGTVSTIDVKTGTKHPADIPVVGESPSGVAITPDGKTAFGTNVNSVSTIDVKSRTKHPTDIPVGTTPTTVAVTPCRR
jgi:YVTN family beta-propeller protein